MKLLNRSLFYLALAFFFIIGIWSVLFYFNLKDEIRDSIDDGLDNNRLLIIQKVKTDSSLLEQHEFGGNNFEIRPISKDNALQYIDNYKDTMMYRLNENDLEPVRILQTAFKHSDNYYQLRIISSLVEEDDLIEDSFWSVLWLFVILVSSIVLVNNLILRRLWNPFYELLNRLKVYRLDKDEKPIYIDTKVKEFRELQDASNILIRHAREAYNSQKQFTENASHELQTPLAVIGNKLELLLESDHLKDMDAKVIAEVIDIANRLTRINKALLLLAKIENKQFPEQELLSLNTLTKELSGHFEDYMEYKVIELSFEELAELKVTMNTSLAEVLLVNLLKNAIFHNIHGGRISLQLTKDTLRICNTGSEKALHPEKIFSRFQKFSDKSQSTGLGLAVSKAICDFYGIKLSYDYSGNAHCFKVNFRKII